MNHSRKKIILAVQDLGVGGSEMTVVNQANMLYKRGFEVLILTLAKHPRKDLVEKLIIPTSNLLTFHFRTVFDVGELFRLVVFLRKYKPDIVISNLFFTSTIIKFAKIFSGKFDLFLREGNIFVNYSFRSRVFYRMTQFMVKRFVVNAVAIKEDMVKNIKIPTTKIEVIYNGINPESFVRPRFSREQKRKEIGVRQDAFVLIHVGSMDSEKKGQEGLLETLARIPQKENTIGIFVGDGRRKKQLMDYARFLGVFDRTIFLGKRRDVIELQHISDIFVFPSLWEGMPNVVLDAMAFGMPIIATSVGGIGEIIKDEESGILVEAKDSASLVSAVMRLKDNVSFRKELGENARKIAAQKKFSWEHHINQLIKCVGL